MSKSDHQKSVYLKNEKIWKAIELLAKEELRSPNFIIERIFENDKQIKNKLGKLK